MNRPLIILLGAMALGVALFFGSYLISQRVYMVCEAPPDDLTWLRKEYHLNDAEMSRIQKLHENYVSQCAAMCQTVAAKKQELAAALNNTTNLSPVAEQKLSELSACRTQCQSKMLQYFVQVSQNMPPTEGHRYLADMQNFSLGLQGESEQSMSPASSHEQHQP
jgi:hypothetical protein